MANQRLSSRYAISILQIATVNNILDKVFADMQMILASIQGSAELQMLLKSPIIKSDDKTKALTAIFSGKIEKATLDFLNLLVSKGRESFLAEICSSFISEYNHAHKIAAVTLVTAIPATDDIMKEVTNLLTKSGNYSKVSIHQEVDASIIGGFILKMEDQLLDNSIQRKLRDVKKQLQS